MPRLNSHLLRHTALAASALALLSVAVPAASAAPQGDPIANKSRATKTAQNKESRKSRTSPHRHEYRRDARTERRSDRRSDRSDRRSDRRDDRSDRRSDRRNDRSHRRSDRRDDRSHRHSDRRRHTGHHGSSRRHYGHHGRNYGYTPRRYHKPRYSRPARYHDHGRRGYRSSYRSGLGISFHLGSPGYSRFRWASSPHSFYRASYGGYGAYQRRTTCRRVTIDGWHHGHRELVSVKQCSNPWDGTYIVQGSERVIACRW